MFYIYNPIWFSISRHLSSKYLKNNATAIVLFILKSYELRNFRLNTLTHFHVVFFFLSMTAILLLNFLAALRKVFLCCVFPIWLFRMKSKSLDIYPTYIPLSNDDEFHINIWISVMKTENSNNIQWTSRMKTWHLNVVEHNTDEEFSLKT